MSATAEIKLHRKQIDLNPDHLKPLTIQAIEKGFSDLKNYLEHLVAKDAERIIKARGKKK